MADFLPYTPNYDFTVEVETELVTSDSMDYTRESAPLFAEKRRAELVFSERDRDELLAMEAFWDEMFPAKTFLYTDPVLHHQSFVKFASEIEWKPTVGGGVEYKVTVKEEGFGPRDLESTRVWLNAGSLHWLADGFAVRRWKDQSGFMNHALQASEASRPALRKNGVNGLPVVVTGGGKYFEVGGGFPVAHVACVFRSPSAAFDDEGTVLGSTQYSDSLQGGLRPFIFRTGATDFWMDPYPVSARKNGSALASPFDLAPINDFMVLSVAAAGPEKYRGYQVGASETIRDASLEIAEIVASYPMPSAAEVALIEDYLSRKYDIALA